MLKVFKQQKAVGLELSTGEIKGATVFLQKGNPHIEQLFTSSVHADQQLNVKQLYTNHPILVTTLPAYDVLVRPLYMPLIKEKDIEEAFIFQAEPHLPYPADNAVLTRQTLNQTVEGTNLTLLSVRKDLLQKHLENWQKFKIEPEQVGCVQSALCSFGSHYIHSSNPYLILYLNDDWISCILIKEGKLIASYTYQEGLELIRKAYAVEIKNSIPIDQFNFDSTETEAHSLLNTAIKRLQQHVARMCYALVKDCKGESVAGLMVTGESVLLPSFQQRLVEKLNIPLLCCKEDSLESFNSIDKQRFAVSIGLALGALQKGINFRQQELSYPHPWRRMMTPLLSYFTLMFILTAVFYLFNKVYVSDQEDRLKQEYVDLLFAMNKSYDQFEQTFQAKHPQAKEKNNGEIVSVMNLDRQDLLQRLEFLHKDLQATPDSFPLLPNTPRVCDVLAWLSSHPLVNYKNQDGSIESRLQLESFNYVMLKRPNQGKKQEKYQVKVELEFSSPTPTWAREFHDALIAANDFVDPKGEVKWSSNRGRYRTSFYLKDKTSYNQ